MKYMKHCVLRNTGNISALKKKNLTVVSFMQVKPCFFMPSTEVCHICFKGCTLSFVTSIFIVLSAISLDKVPPHNVLTFENHLKHLLGLFEFLCFKYNLCLMLHLSDVQEPARSPYCLLMLSHLLAVPSSYKVSHSEEEPRVLNKPFSYGTAVAVDGIVSTLKVKPLFHSSYWQERQSSCRMACVPTALSSGGV